MFNVYTIPQESTLSVDEQETGALGILCIATFLLVMISLFFSYRDLQFAFQGKKAQAEFIKFSKIRGRHGESHVHKHVLYSFVDFEGKRQRGYDKVPYKLTSEDVNDLQIKYLSGKIKVDGVNTVSRIAGGFPFWGIFFFSTSSLAFFVSCVYLWKNIRPPTLPKLS